MVTRAKWLLLNLYQNAGSDMVEMRKALLKELMEELGTTLAELEEELKDG